MKYYIAVLIGCFIYMLFQLNSAYKLTDFSWKKFIRTNWIPAVINITVGFVLIWTKDELVETLRGALIIGFSGQVLFKKIADVFDKSKDTLIKV
jgi:hypothetical protein